MYNINVVLNEKKTNEESFIQRFAYFHFLHYTHILVLELIILIHQKIIIATLASGNIATENHLQEM